MNLFDKLVDEALKNQPHVAPLRIVVEKELLHHEILRVLSQNDLLIDLTFVGGTCLRSIYGVVRLSEDLDFTGGINFDRKSLSALAQLLIDTIYEKYGFLVQVSEPIKDKLNVDTWKIKVETRPQQKNLPSQRISIDICAVPSYDRKPMLLLNPYGVDMGTSGLIIQAQTREEIYADKLLDFAFRPNRIKHRDLWDIGWLHGVGVKPTIGLIPDKLRDRNQTNEHFLTLFDERRKLLSEDSTIAREFDKEMRRFLGVEQLKYSLEQENFWTSLVHLVDTLGQDIRKTL